MTDQEILDLLENKDARKAFIRMGERDRDITLYDMVVFIRSLQAGRDKVIADLRTDVSAIERAYRQISRRNDTITLTTSQKIDAHLSKTWFYLLWSWFRDRVLPNLVTWFLIIILTGILYTSFGGKLP